MHCTYKPKHLSAKLFDYETGELLLPVTMSFSATSKDCAFVNSPEYPWLPEFLVGNDLARPTYHSLVKNKKVYSEYKFKKGK